MLMFACSLGMIMLEAATNVVVPDQGEPWHRLRREDLSQVAAHPVVARVRRATDACVGFAASPLASPPPGFLAEVLGRELRPMSPVGEEDDGDVRMDLSP
jgi:mitosis inhibitor protein kinase SWE1